MLDFCIVVFLVSATPGPAIRRSLPQSVLGFESDKHWHACHVIETM